MPATQLRLFRLTLNADGPAMRSQLVYALISFITRDDAPACFMLIFYYYFLRRTIPLIHMQEDETASGQSHILAGYD